MENLTLPWTMSSGQMPLRAVFARVLVNFFEEKWPAAAVRARSFLCMGPHTLDGGIVAQKVSCTNS